MPDVLAEFCTEGTITSTVTVQFLFCFILNLSVISEYKSLAGCIWRGDLSESILRVGALIIFWRGCDKVSRHSLIIRSTSILDRSLYLS